MFDCSLRSRGSRLKPLPSSFTCRQKSVSARSFVQDSGSRAMFDCSLRSRGSRLEPLPSSLTCRQKSVSARSFVQDSGARSWARLESADFVVARRGKCASDRSSVHCSLRSLRLALVGHCLPHSLADDKACVLAHSSRTAVRQPGSARRRAISPTLAATWVR
jgi:hypothetical protein